MKEDKKITTPKGKEYTVGEIEKSNRFFKSATPKYTPDWYVKWIASVIMLVAVTARSVPEVPQWVDLYFSLVGVLGWLYVSLVWNDRALILLNATMFVLLLSGVLRSLF
jgi:hypothetical protein